MEDNHKNTLLGELFIPTSNRVPKLNSRLIAIDIYGRYVMELQTNKNNITYYAEEQFKTAFQKI